MDNDCLTGLQDSCFCLSSVAVLLSIADPGLLPVILPAYARLLLPGTTSTSFRVSTTKYLTQPLSRTTTTLYGEQRLITLQPFAQETQTFLSATIFPLIVTMELSLIARHTVIWPIGKPSIPTGCSTNVIGPPQLMNSETQIYRSILPILLCYPGRSRPMPSQPAKAGTMGSLLIMWTCKTSSVPVAPT